MTLPGRTHRRARARVAASVLVAFCVCVLGPGASAQVLDPVKVLPAAADPGGPAANQNSGRDAVEGSKGGQAATIHQWLETVRLQDISAYQDGRIGQAKASAEMQRGYRGRRGRGDRGVAGLVLGVVGGFVAGGAIGVAVAEHSYHGTDPALHGFLIGAPIGAVVGGFIGYALAR